MISLADEFSHALDKKDSIISQIQCCKSILSNLQKQKSRFDFKFDIKWNLLFDNQSFWDSYNIFSDYDTGEYFLWFSLIDTYCILFVYNQSSWTYEITISKNNLLFLAPRYNISYIKEKLHNEIDHRMIEMEKTIDLLQKSLT